METNIRNKCKAYTSLEQSKKLAEILPPESADMYYAHDSVFDELESIPTITEEDDHFELFPNDVGCWSLAALISVLPLFIEFKGNKYYLRFMKDYVEYANDEISITDRCLHTTGNNNLIDAAFEMILKLHKLKMLL